MKRLPLFFSIVLSLFNCEKEDFIIKKDILIDSYTRDVIEILTTADTTWWPHKSIVYKYNENNNLTLALSGNNSFEEYYYDSENRLQKIVDGYNQNWGSDRDYNNNTYVSREGNKVIEEHYRYSGIYEIREYSLNSDQVVRMDYYKFDDGIQTSHHYQVYEWEKDNISVVKTYYSNRALYSTTTFEYEFDLINPWKTLEPSHRPISENPETKEHIQYNDGWVHIYENSYEQGANYITKVSQETHNGEKLQYQILEHFTY